jgi:hypothetical protein
MHYLPHDRQRHAEILHQFRGPGPDRNDQPVRSIPPRFRFDFDTPIIGRPTNHSLTGFEHGSQLTRPIEKSLDTLFHEQIPGLRFQDADEFFPHSERRETSLNLGRAKCLDRQVVNPCRVLHTSDQFPVFPSDGQTGMILKEVAAGLTFQSAPEIERASAQRHIGRMFVIGGADDAGVPVRRTAVVNQRKLFEPQHTLTAAGQFADGGGTHAAQPENDGVEICHPMISPRRTRRTQRESIEQSGSHSARWRGQSGHHPYSRTARKNTSISDSSV